ncbi:coenzyme A pyrophosphatase [Sulfolobales archaeon HS-7]|nr:coenzyme A pyrophosphatase [Sulfolobales archaeon HS-7]
MVDAAVTVFFDGEAVLLIKRVQRDGDPWSGHIALPGGFIKQGETPREAAIREAQEEVSLTPRIVEKLGIYSPNNRNIKVAVFLSPKTGEPRADSNEIQKAFWAELNNMVEKDDAFYYHEYRIWGMTYRILKDVINNRENLRKLLQKEQKTSQEVV